MLKHFLIFLCMSATSVTSFAQTKASDVLSVAQRANDYFMAKYEDPTVPTNVNRIRPSSLWTRAVYYEGLMTLYEIDPQQRYIDYTDRWASFHQWTPRNGIGTNDADDQCCAQTYLERYIQSGGEEKIVHVKENLEQQMVTPNKKSGTNQKTQTILSSLYGWWTWIDAIQMGMPIYFQMSKITGDHRYIDHAMKMYTWSRDTLAGGLFNVKEGLWWRDKDYVPPYKEPDGQQCYWSRGNGWVYAALVRCMNYTSPKDKVYKQLKRDFVLMSAALLKCQREDGFWNPSLVSTNYAMKETSGTALFLYGMAWGIQKGYLKADVYRPACDRAWTAMVRDAVHPDGFLGWMQGTGKDPSAGQPLSYTKIPDFEDYGTGCFLLGAAEYYKLLKQNQ
ncbi:MAG: glycoside hydrolase family 88 protein [Prevotella sp.]|nr:glycoside hydrolase family 88 protein [Prevotella sp.]